MREGVTPTLQVNCRGQECSCHTGAGATLQRGPKCQNNSPDFHQPLLSLRVWVTAWTTGPGEGVTLCRKPKPFTGQEMPGLGCGVLPHGSTHQASDSLERFQELCPSTPLPLALKQLSLFSLGPSPEDMLWPEEVPKPRWWGDSALSPTEP